MPSILKRLTFCKGCQRRQSESVGKEGRGADGGGSVTWGAACKSCAVQKATQLTAAEQFQQLQHEWNLYAIIKSNSLLSRAQIRELPLPPVWVCVCLAVCASVCVINLSKRLNYMHFSNNTHGTRQASTVHTAYTWYFLCTGKVWGRETERERETDSSHSFSSSLSALSSGTSLHFPLPLLLPCPPPSPSSLPPSSRLVSISVALSRYRCHNWNSYCKCECVRWIDAEIHLHLSRAV